MNILGGKCFGGCCKFTFYLKMSYASDNPNHRFLGKDVFNVSKKGETLTSSFPKISGQ